jgi:hypothetical protein
VVAALALTVLMAVLHHSGPVGTPEVTPEAYWTIFGRDISKVDALYLSTFTRAIGLLLGAAFAMIWRPVALMRGPLRSKGRMLDGVALVGFAALAAMAWWMYLLGPDGADPWLFRGGFLLCAIATLMMIAAVTHQRAMTSRVLSIPVLLWVGTRSYGLYLYHWPIYQIIRNIAGNHLKVHEFVLAMAATAVITEASYRFIETPIRKRTFGASLARIRRSPVGGPRNALLGAGAVVAALSLFAGVSLATAPVEENEVRQTLEQGAEFTCDVVNDPTCSGVGLPDPGAVTDDEAAPDAATDPSGSGVPVPPPAETTTTTTQPPAPIAQFALGDSVMLGAAGELAKRGYVVDAAESRQFSDGLVIVEQLKAADRLGDVVVIHLGTNGDIAPADLTAMMEALVDVPQVLLLTIEVDRAWTEDNNSLIYGAASTYANVSVLYWADLSDSCPGDCFQSDGFHLRPDGQAYYAALIDGALEASA